MDIERMKKLISKNIEVGKAIKHIREVIKNDMHMKQDSYYRTSEDLKPSIDVEKDLIKTITKKQDEVIDAIRGLRLQQPPPQGPPPPQQGPPPPQQGPPPPQQGPPPPQQPPPPPPPNKGHHLLHHHHHHQFSHLTQLKTKNFKCLMMNKIWLITYFRRLNKVILN